jgi:AcrR family transcriptional regulator
VTDLTPEGRRAWPSIASVTIDRRKYRCWKPGRYPHQVEPVERKHVRRGPNEVRELVLKAAHQLFTEQGYHGTTTKQIAVEAGVGEPVIFRNFGTKAELFQEAILKPFTEFITNWAADWDRRPPKSSDPEVITSSFVKGFYAVVQEHRNLLGTLIAARVQGGDRVLDRIAADVSQALADGLRIMRRVLLDHGQAREYKSLDPPMTVAVAAGAVMSIVLLDDWLFPGYERRPSKTRQIEELTQMLLHGIAHRD